MYSGKSRACSQEESCSYRVWWHAGYVGRGRHCGTGKYVRIIYMHSSILLHCSNTCSTKFLRNRMYPDRPLANFHRNKFHRSRILVSHAHFWRLHAQFVFTVAATLCSAVGFQKVFLLRDGLCQGPSQFRSRNSAKVLNNYCFKETMKIKHLENLLYSIKFTQMPSCILLASTFIQSCFQTFAPHFITVGW